MWSCFFFFFFLLLCMSKYLVVYQLCNLSLAIPVLSLAIPGLSWLSLVCPSLSLVSPWMSLVSLIPALSSLICPLAFLFFIYLSDNKFFSCLWFILSHVFSDIYLQLKLDGVGPVDNRPSTDKLNHFVRKKHKKHVTCDTWHVTCDTWHVTLGTWHVTCLGGWTFSHIFSSLALTICDLWYYKDLEEKDEWLN